MTTRALTLLNEQGDQSLIWDEDSDETMIAFIEAKMKAGWQFFIVEPRFFGLLPPKKTPLKNAEEACKYRAVSIRDEDMARLVEEGAADIVRTPPEPVKAVKKSKDPKEIASSQSVGVRAARGG